MGLTDWNFLLPHDPQDYPWDCSANATAWALRTIGRDYSEQDVIAGLGPSRITPMYGLMDASGAGLVEWLAEIGVNAANNADASWADCTAAAGYQPLLIGGRAWVHWVAVRMGPSPAPERIPDMLALMNGANGYMGVYQTLSPDQFAALGSFSAVWFNSW
jgi:hypothetical protein